MLQYSYENQDSQSVLRIVGLSPEQAWRLLTVAQSMAAGMVGPPLPVPSPELVEPRQHEPAAAHTAAVPPPAVEVPPASPTPPATVEAPAVEPDLSARWTRRRKYSGASYPEAEWITARRIEFEGKEKRMILTLKDGVTVVLDEQDREVRVLQPDNLDEVPEVPSRSASKASPPPAEPDLPDDLDDDSDEDDLDEADDEDDEDPDSADQHPGMAQKVADAIAASSGAKTMREVMQRLLDVGVAKEDLAGILQEHRDSLQVLQRTNDVPGRVARVLESMAMA